MCPLSRETRRSGSGTSRKTRFSPTISLPLLRTHASSCDCRLLCSHMSVCGMRTRTWFRVRVTTRRAYARSRCSGAFLKQHGVSNGTDTFSCLMHTYQRASAHTGASRSARDQPLVWDVAGHLEWQLQVRRLTWRPATIFGVPARHVAHTIASVTLDSLSPLTTALPCLPLSIFQSALASHSPSPFFGSVKMKLNRFKTIFLVNAVF